MEIFNMISAIRAKNNPILFACNNKLGKRTTNETSNNLQSFLLIVIITEPGKISRWTNIKISINHKNITCDDNTIKIVKPISSTIRTHGEFLAE